MSIAALLSIAHHLLVLSQSGLPMGWKCFEQPGEEGLTWLAVESAPGEISSSSSETQAGLASSTQELVATLAEN